MLFDADIHLSPVCVGDWALMEIFLNQSITGTGDERLDQMRKCKGLIHLSDVTTCNSKNLKILH